MDDMGSIVLGIFSGLGLFSWLETRGWKFLIGNSWLEILGWKFLIGNSWLEILG
jgi:hypothetical protein